MGVEGKRLLVLGAGRGQIGLYKAAKRWESQQLQEPCLIIILQEFLWQMKCAL